MKKNIIVGEDIEHLFYSRNFMARKVVDGEILIVPGWI